MSATAMRLALRTSTGRIVAADSARAVERFRPSGPLGHRARIASYYGPLRSTRARAMRDACMYWEHTDRKAHR